MKFEYDPEKLNFGDMVRPRLCLRLCRCAWLSATVCSNHEDSLCSSWATLFVRLKPGVLVHLLTTPVLQVEYFYRIHDPTTPNQQGNDRGTQYRSAIFYHDDEQKRVAEVGVFSMPISASHGWMIHWCVCWVKCYVAPFRKKVILLNLQQGCSIFNLSATCSVSEYRPCIMVVVIS